MIVARSAAAGSCVTIRMVFPNSLLSFSSSVEDVVGALAIEVAGRLVGDDDRRVVDDGARDGDALLLPAGELARVVLHAVLEADDAQRGLRALLALGRRRGCVSRSGSSTFSTAVSTGIRLYDWKMKPMRARAPLRELALAQPVEALARDLDRARGRPVEAGDQVEQRRLAGAGRAHQRLERRPRARRDRGSRARALSSPPRAYVFATPRSFTMGDASLPLRHLRAPLLDRLTVLRASPAAG